MEEVPQKVIYRGQCLTEGIMEGDTSKGKMGTNTSESNMHGMGNK